MKTVALTSACMLVYVCVRVNFLLQNHAQNATDYNNKSNTNLEQPFSILHWDLLKNYPKRAALYC